MANGGAYARSNCSSSSTRMRLYKRRRNDAHRTAQQTARRGIGHQLHRERLSSQVARAAGGRHARGNGRESLAPRLLKREAGDGHFAVQRRPVCISPLKLLLNRNEEPGVVRKRIASKLSAKEAADQRPPGLVGSVSDSMYFHPNPTCHSDPGREQRTRRIRRLCRCPCHRPSERMYSPTAQTPKTAESSRSRPTSRCRHSKLCSNRRRHYPRQIRRVETAWSRQPHPKSTYRSGRLDRHRTAEEHNGTS